MDVTTCHLSCLLLALSKWKVRGSVSGTRCCDSTGFGGSEVTSLRHPPPRVPHDLPDSGTDLLEQRCTRERPWRLTAGGTPPRPDLGEGSRYSQPASGFLGHFFYYTGQTNRGAQSDMLCQVRIRLKRQKGSCSTFQS